MSKHRLTEILTDKYELRKNHIYRVVVVVVHLPLDTEAQSTKDFFPDDDMECGSRCFSSN